jgi:hypothetical protein
MPGSIARNGDWPGLKKSPGSPGLFCASSHPGFSAREQAQLSMCGFAHLAAAPACYAGRMSQEKLVLFSILLGFALIALAALVLVIFLP